MAASEKTRWKNWADELRQEMMTNLTPEVTKSVNTIVVETATTKATTTLRSARFWRACQQGKSPNDVLASAGLEVDFDPNEVQHVEEVTLRLNDTWLSILQGVLERKGDSRS